MFDRTLLVTISGSDRPGVTRSIFASIANFPVDVVDMEQLVVRGKLILVVLVELNDPEIVEEPQAVAVLNAIRKSVRTVASDLNLEVSTVSGIAVDETEPVDRFTVVLMGNPLSPRSVATVAAQIAELGGNIDRFHRIASFPVTAIRIEGSGASADSMRRPLSKTSAQCGVDLSVQDIDLESRGQYLVVMDVDSTLIQDEVVDMIGSMAGVGAEIAAITKRAMDGEIDFAESLRERVSLLNGASETLITQATQQIRLTPGARTLCRTLKRLGYRIVLVSGGFTNVITDIAQELGVDQVRANTLEVSDGKLTGHLVGPIIDRVGKKNALEQVATEYGIPRRRVIAIGDGANDIDMLEAAGLGVAFNAKPILREAADTSVNVPYLDSVLYLLGITREEIERADARDALHG